jgi:carbamoyltransferase
VIGWFRGRMEFGARALGNRSILADPSQPGIAQRINKLVKFRESWRPFSASLLESAADDYIDRGNLHSHDEAMALSVKTTAKFRESYPDIVHVDGTARLQVVRVRTTPIFIICSVNSPMQRANGCSSILRLTAR